METVSEEFKKAIKSSEREIKGYVEVVYDDKDGSDYVLSSSPNRLRNSLDTEIVDGSRKSKKYASLEKNYTELDGSFILPNYNVKGDKTGYVSDDIFSDIANPTITLSKEDNYINSSGITIYFENNIAQDFTLTILSSDNEVITTNIQNNTKGIYQQIFESKINIKSLSINITKIEYTNRRIRIPEIDFGISQVYEDGDLVSFTVNEEIDLLFTSTPINDCTVNLNNYDNQFNPLNPVGLTKYLTDNCVIKPFIGVLTEKNGIEYVSMGYFYLKDWSSDTDGGTTLNGRSLMEILANTTIKSDGQFLYNNGIGWYSSELNEYLTRMYGYKFELSTGESYNYYLKKTNLLEYLQTLFSFMTDVKSPKKFYISRNNIIVLDAIKYSSVDTISRRELIEDVKYENKSVVNKVNITDISTFNQTSSDRSDLLNQTYVLTSEEEYIWFSFDKSTNNKRNKTFSYENNGHGKAELIDYNTWMAYIKFTGNVGDEIIVHLIGYKFDNPPTINVTFSNDAPIGDTLNLDFTDYFDADNSYLQSTAEFYLTQDKKHKVTGNYNGDPSLIPGDTFTVETKFGNKNIIMTKHSLTFDGGLSGNFEGMGD
ncbi:MAG: hypothetical protein J6B89_03405 [Bacilli bacterium]|nr:hypothetical protein [Bacilli bacterium]